MTLNLKRRLLNLDWKKCKNTAKEEEKRSVKTYKFGSSFSDRSNTCKIHAGRKSASKLFSVLKNHLHLCCNFKCHFKSEDRYWFESFWWNVKRSETDKVQGGKFTWKNSEKVPWFAYFDSFSRVFQLNLGVKIKPPAS